MTLRVIRPNLLGASATVAHLENPRFPDTPIDIAQERVIAQISIYLLNMENNVYLPTFSMYFLEDGLC